MQAQLNEAGTLKRMIEVLKDMITEANLEFTTDGIVLHPTMDGAHVSMVDFRLERALFESYECPKPFVAGIGVNGLAQILKNCDNDDRLQLSMTSPDDDMMTIRLVTTPENASKKKTVPKQIEVQMKLMQVETEQLEVPPLEVDIMCDMPANEFLKTCKQLESFGDSVVIEMNYGQRWEEDHVRFTVINSESNGVIVKFDANRPADSNESRVLVLIDDPSVDSSDNRPVEEEIDEKEEKAVDDGETDEVETEDEDGFPIKRKRERLSKPKEKPNPQLHKKLKPTMSDVSKSEKRTSTKSLSLTFALTYLSVFAKGAAFTDRVRIWLHPRQPLVIEYELFTSVSKKSNVQRKRAGKVRFFLAPKIDDNE